MWRWRPHDPWPRSLQAKVRNTNHGSMLTWEAPLWDQLNVLGILELQVNSLYGQSLQVVLSCCLILGCNFDGGTRPVGCPMHFWTQDCLICSVIFLSGVRCKNWNIYICIYLNIHISCHFGVTQCFTFLDGTKVLVQYSNVHIFRDLMSF